MYISERAKWINVSVSYKPRDDGVSIINDSSVALPIRSRSSGDDRSDIRTYEKR